MVVSEHGVACCEMGVDGGCLETRAVMVKVKVGSVYNTSGSVGHACILAFVPIRHLQISKHI